MRFRLSLGGRILTNLPGDTALLRSWIYHGLAGKYDSLAFMGYITVFLSTKEEISLVFDSKTFAKPSGDY